MADRTIVYRLRAEAAQARAQLAAFGGAARKTATDLTAIDAAGQKTRRGMDQLAGTAGRVGLVAAAGLGAAAITAANFDAKMSEVQAATTETAANMDRLREAAIQAGADTAFSASEAADGITELAKAGVSTEEILSGGLAGALDLAAAGQIQVGEAAEYSAKAMTQFSLAGDQVPHVADLLAAAAGKAVGEVGDFGQALNQAGLIAAQTGLTIEDTVGTLAAFAQAGLQGSDAGTSFKTMLQRLQNPLGKGAEAMKKYGIDAYDTQGNFVGITEVAGQLQDKLGGLDQATRDAALAQIFGSDAVRAANVLYREGADGIQNWIDQTNDSGFAAEQAATKLDNLKGDFEAFMGSLETALIGTGDGAQGPLRSLTQGATEAVNAYNDLPDPIKQTTAAALGLTAAVGGGAWFGSKVIQGVADTRQALSDLGITANLTKGSLGKMAATAGGILALGAAVGALDEALARASGARLDTENLSRDLESVSKGFESDTLDTIIKDIRNLDSTILSVQEPLDEFGKGFGLFGDTMLDRAKDNISEVDQTLATLVESGNAEQAAAIFDRIAEGVGDRSLAADAFQAYGTALRNAGEAGGLFTPALDAVAAASDQAGTAVQQAAARTERMSKALKEARGEARGTASEFIGLGGAVESGKQSLTDFLRNMEKQAAALRDFRQNAEKAARRGLSEGLIAELQRLGPEGARQMAQLAGATDREIERANRAWRSGQREADKYTDAVAGVPKSVSTEVNVNAGQALNIIDLVERQMRYLDGLRSTTYVDTVRRTRTSGGVQEYAAGGAIHGPGTSTSDSIPIWASDGEFMMKAAAVQKYGPAMMHDINSLRFAEGGMVQRYAVPASPGAGSSGGRLSLDGVRVEGRIDARGYLHGVMRDVDRRIDDRIGDYAADDVDTGRLNYSGSGD